MKGNITLLIFAILMASAVQAAYEDYKFDGKTFKEGLDYTLTYFQQNPQGYSQTLIKQGFDYFQKVYSSCQKQLDVKTEKKTFSSRYHLFITCMEKVPNNDNGKNFLKIPIISKWLKAVSIQYGIIKLPALISKKVKPVEFIPKKNAQGKFIV